MQKIVTSVVIASFLPVLFVAGAPLAQAQVYTSYPPSTSYTTPYNNYSTASSCVALTAPLAVGTSDFLSGGQVSQLQTFLVRMGFLSSAFVTGYYGPITASAVAQFQASHSVPSTGVVGPLTRAAIQQVSCNGGIGINPIIPSNPVYPVSPVYPTYPTYPTYPVNPGYPYFNTAPVLNQLTVNTNTATLTMTLQGYGFSASNNTVYFGPVTINGIASVNGTQLSFNVPTNLAVNTTYQVTVSNGSATSNALSYYLSSNTNCLYNSGYSNCNCNYSYNGYNYNNCNCTYPVYSGTNYNYNNNYNNCTNNNGTLSLSYLSPTSGSVGTQITIQGSGFSQYGNIVHFSAGGAMNVQSFNNGTLLYFTVPQTLSPCSVTTSGVCPQYAQQVTPGQYGIYVTNQNGQSSNTLSFQVY